MKNSNIKKKILLVYSMSISICFAQNGLLAVFKFNGNLNDSTGNCRLSASLPVTYTSDLKGTPNSALFLSGNNTIRVDFLELNSNRTISLYINPIRNSQKNGFPIITGGESNRGDFFAISNTDNSSQNSCYFRQDYTYIDHWGTPCYKGGDTPAPASIWTHLAFSFDGTTIKFYLNGRLQNTIQNVLFPWKENSIFIGSNYIGGTTTQQFFTGSLDEIRFYNRALSDLEIRQLSRQN